MLSTVVQSLREIGYYSSSLNRFHSWWTSGPDVTSGHGAKGNYA